MISRFELTPLRLSNFHTFLAVTLLSVLLSGCGGGSSVPVNIHGDGTSGVRGTAIYFVPNTTTAQILPNAVITVQKTNPSVGKGPIVYGSVIAQTQADAQGNYSIALAPGSYGIGGKATEPNNNQGVTASIYVSAHQYLQLNVGFTTPTVPIP